MLRTLLVSLVLVTAFTPAATGEEKPATENPIELSQRAGKEYEQGRFIEAADLYRRVLNVLPRTVSTRLALSRALVRAGRVDDALRELATATDFGMRFDEHDAAWDTVRSDPRFQKLAGLMRARTAPIIRSETEFLLEKDLIPENIALDAKGGNFYVGSMYKSKIVRVSASGEVSDFIPSRRDGLWGVLGMKIDPSRRELWANSCNIDSPPMEVPHIPTKGQAAIFRFELDSGKLIAKYPGPHGSAERPFCFNDLVLVPNGDVYATAGGDGLFRLRAGSQSVEQFVPPDGSWFNGITMTPDGRTLFAASHFDGVVGFDIATKKRTLIDVPHGATLGAIDGLYFHEGSLIGVQGSDPRRVVRAWLSDDMSRVTRFAVLEQDHPLYDFPLTGTIVGNDLVYVAGSQLRSFADGKIWPIGKLKDTVILRLPIDLPPNDQVAGDDAMRSLLKMHAEEIRSHFERDAAWIGDTTGETFVSASGGKIQRSGSDDVRRFFERYFDGAEYLEYENLEEPVVRLSDDGSMGWVLSRTKVRRVVRSAEGPDTERNFVYAGIMIYQRHNGAWKRVANASTFE